MASQTRHVEGCFGKQQKRMATGQQMRVQKMLILRALINLLCLLIDKLLKIQEMCYALNLDKNEGKQKD